MDFGLDYERYKGFIIVRDVKKVRKVLKRLHKQGYEWNSGISLKSNYNKSYLRDICFSGNIVIIYKFHNSKYPFNRARKTIVFSMIRDNEELKNVIERIQYS